MKGSSLPLLPMAPSNPACLSPLIRSLFPATDVPASVVAAHLSAAGDPTLLFPAERQDIAHAVPKRIQEFAAGRLCARRALAQFGVGDFVLRVAPDRQPVWPAGLLGSITHTDGWCAAVVADGKEFIGVGVDCEIVGRVGGHILPRIGTAAETAWVLGLPAAEQGRALAFLFAAKEAFYKAQFPSTAERLSFHDVAVEAADWGGRRGVFRTRPTRRIAIEELAGGAFLGRYEFHDEFVSAGVALPAVNRPCRPGTP